MFVTIVEKLPQWSSAEVTSCRSAPVLTQVFASVLHSVDRMRCRVCEHHQVRAAILEFLPGCSYDNVREAPLAAWVLAQHLLTMKKKHTPRRFLASGPPYPPLFLPSSQFSSS
jgi:hypothetical protein